jgi:hypothetical protein
MIKAIEKMVKAISARILELFPRSVSVLQLTRVTEKFDSVTRPPFAGRIGDRINHQ